MAEWTAAYINDLPDESFAYVEPGQKDEGGKTTPRSLRHLPYRDKDGKIDPPHLRNALARLPQTDIPLEAKRQALRKLIEAAKQAGVEVNEASYRQYDLADQGVLQIPFFRLGSWKHPKYGEIKADKKFLADLIRNFKDGVLGRPVFVRLGHDRDNKTTFGDVPAEGWVKDIVERDGILCAIAEPTTSEAADLVRSGRYRFASAEYDPNFVDKETGKRVGPVLITIALTNEPFLTRLPEAVVLSDPPGTIYLDYEEVKGAMQNDFVNKLAEGIAKFFENIGVKFGPAAGGGLTEEERQKLAEIDSLKAQLEEHKSKLALAENQISESQRAVWTSQVESRLGTLVAKGIPPAMCDQVKAILLSNPTAAAAVVKLADGKEASLADHLYGVLEALPEEHRIKLAQAGRQVSPNPNSPEEIKKLADEDVKAMGGKVTEDGKYVL